MAMKRLFALPLAAMLVGAGAPAAKTDPAALSATVKTLAAPDFETRKAAAEKMMIGFHLEDMEVCTAVQRGFYSTGYRRGRLSHLEMPIWLIERYLAARSRNTWPTYDRPAAPSQR